MRDEIYSVGIDIGTSTTQLIFSKLVIENLANAYSVPRINIVSKEVVYRSDIYFTPLINQNEIDSERVRTIIEAEYHKAGFTPEDLSTGAVIITGETARKKNANDVLRALSDMAGDFVVATAGPDLESVLAAKGAGADRISKETRGIIANVDIGGGTSNIAVYRNGELTATSCIDIGGRLIKIESGHICYVYEKIKRMAAQGGIDICVGDSIDEYILQCICEQMANQVAQSLNLMPRDNGHHNIYTNDGAPIPEDICLDGIMFSGGVADCMQADIKDPFCYQDIGILLGNAIKGNKALNSIPAYKASETIRATVVGAGTHTTTVSGSTISVSQTVLPLKNVPVLKVSAQDERDEERFVMAIENKIPIYYSDGEEKHLAISFEGESIISYEDIRRMVRALRRGAKRLIDSSYPLIIVTEKDIAKVLGNLLRTEIGTWKDILCLDSIHAEDGDYIDIGEPLAQGNVVPVIVKTLIFNS